MKTPIKKHLHRVIVAEDDAGTAEFISAALNRYNFSVRIARDGRVALKYLEEESYDLLLCDIMMPYVDGFKLLETSKSRKTKMPRILMLTALSDYDTVVKVKALGADGYLVKPATATQLVAKVRAILELDAISMVDKNTMSFSIHTTIENDKLMITLKGCPVKNPQSELVRAMSAALTVRARYAEAQFVVGPDFVYDAAAWVNLRAMAQYLQKFLNISPQHIGFAGDFFLEADSDELKEFKKQYTVSS